MRRKLYLDDTLNKYFLKQNGLIFRKEDKVRIIKNIESYKVIESSHYRCEAEYRFLTSFLH